MSTEFLMPKLGLTMEEGKILEWLVDDDAVVQAGTPVLRIETDKVESDVESPGAGRLQRIGRVGDTHRCGDVIGYLLGDQDAHVVARQDDPTPRVSTSRPLVSPNAYRIAATLGVDPRPIRGSGPDGRVVSEDVEEYARSRATVPQSDSRATRPPSPATTETSSSGRTVATAAARQLADLLGIDLALVPTRDSRISRDDVAEFVRSRLAEVRPDATPTQQNPSEIRPLTGMRNIIARRMHGSLREMAQLTLTMEAPFERALAHREAHADRSRVPGITDYVLAATARALKAHPIVNSQLTPSGIALLPHVHLGLAVALDDGLVVPVIHDADALTLWQIADESARLAQAARSGALSMGDLEGGTMSVTALGMYGVDSFTPVINPPNTAILGVGRIRPIPVATKKSKKAKKPSGGKTRTADSVAFVQSMTLSLTWDHRVFDGAPAAAFCRDIVERLQDPDGLENLD